LKKFLAFTLAETLIVMGIIGVVAALTLPNLNSSTADKEKVVKVNKIYSDLNDALGRVIAVYGPFNAWYDNDLSARKIGNRLLDFIKVSKACNPDVSGDCPSIIKTSQTYRFITADGMLVEMYDGQLWVDIDGAQKGSNSPGKDIFSFYFYSGEIVPCGQDILTTNMTRYLSSCSSNGSWSCTAWVIMYQNMDYLKCHDKLSETVTSCK